jgi:5-(carboxyamino)imidazole ribonucleotide synthase
LHYPSSILGGGRISRQIANALNYVGVLAVEVFVVQGNGGPKVLVKDIAPRGAQFRTLDGRLRVDLAVRAEHSCHRRLAAEHAAPPWPGHHDQPDRRDINSYEQWLTVPGATAPDRR